MLTAINESDYPYEKEPFLFLSLGIICPRKNQMFAVEMFKKLAKGRKDVKLVLVGARYTRTYESEYVEKLRQIIGNDKRIEIHDVTDNVDQFYQVADCLLFTSKNEVTPLVLPEAMSYGIPIISTNVGGISEMFTHGKEGFLFEVGDEEKALSFAQILLNDEKKRKEMSRAGIAKYDSSFRMNLMVNNYRNLILRVAPPIILLDLDGTLIDWDRKFLESWNQRSIVTRNSYYMEDCVEEPYRQEALDVMRSPGFFEFLPLMKGALKAIEEMEEHGFNLKICTAPIYESDYCCQEKVNWIKKNLGEKWLKKLVMCSDKSLIKADYLIDDKPFDQLNDNQSPACWKQIIYDQPYNRDSNLPRIYRWKDWAKILLPQLLIHSDSNPYAISPCQSISRPQNSEQLQKRQDLYIGIQEPLTPDELSLLKGTLSFIKSGDTPNSSPKAKDNLKSKQSMEERQKAINLAREWKTEFDDTDEIESKAFTR